MTDLGPGQARILDRGYRHHTGERSGVAGAVRSVVQHSVQRAMGLRRTIWAKVLPFASVLIAYLPAIVFVGVIALFPVKDVPDDFLPTYGDYYGFVIAAIMLFVAFVAPEVLCTDRRTGMLGVYLSSPLDRRSYLLAKALAVAAVLSLVCLGPPLLMLVANVLQSQGPEGFGDIVTTLLRVIGAGAVLTLFYTGITMGIATLTDRKSVATASIILLFLVSITVAGSLDAGGEGTAVNILSPTILSLDLASRSHGEVGYMQPVSSVVLWGAWAAWTFGGFGLAWANIKRLPVTR